MDKNIKKIISEAFDELYQEIINEEPETLRKDSIEASDIDNLISISKKRGLPLPKINFSHEASRENFDKIIEELVSQYKETRNSNIKSTIQATFAPTPGSAMQRRIAGTFINNPEIDDAAMSAYEQVLIKNFDQNIDAYKLGTAGFGAMVLRDMKNKVYNYIVKGFRGGGLGGSSLDVSKDAARMDDPIGDEGGTTFGDKIAGFGELGSAEERADVSDEYTNKLKTALKSIIEFLEEDLDFENIRDKRRFIVFKNMIQGVSPEEILEEHPGLFKNIQAISIDWKRFLESEPFQQAQQYVNNVYDLNLDLENVNPKKLVQTYAQNPDFSGEFTKVQRVFTPEMKKAKKELEDVLENVGVPKKNITAILNHLEKSKTKYSEKNDEKDLKGAEKVIYDIIQMLHQKNMNEEAKMISDALDNFENAVIKAKSSGKYNVKMPEIPTPEEEEAFKARKAKGLNESIYVDRLMERVLKRLSSE